ncbi:McKusick-Kaufman/Bardet-Biedl syndromes putative chaperonin-like [Mizuhopecten yessoensis]|uniref:McKusick-Kaufman/Bardet-Biedl syndromes putative chaperonin-like n=1 Tax=Mizuhopecten yessoensis TaxID=6573 RepID=UPI000B45BBED|nr:McKusick-Kaufman/Bardet-Biedl syndromes putative chaperonin-like [Mizuhopecten yessoensis]XP_021360375.1 McKusick-Kaufman/Bardet-Biedl syndromes putative chaperonin-like [Mizuhopecten yessoensis]XP_021360376.1 McKusick-Kaufman/Bardet-Biedl syndromes putative chaperonin-like [Mizuhopecten yessoensis]XP_021360377.1 McKusick-Kaufman/Bardet-Biedl syndromes putative chaperonin-like [Mizuhopecten yessoensis]
MQSHSDAKTGSRLDAKTESHISYLTLESDQVVRALVLMEQITSSSRGPFGKIKMVQNSVGGHLTMTSTSARLLSAMSFSNPIVKLVVNSAQGHLKRFNDSGHLLMSISLNLILESLKLVISRKILMDLFEIFLGMCLEYLGDKDNEIQTDVVFSDLKQMSSIVKSILISKPLCRFSTKNLKVCGDLLLETFLSSLPNNNTVQNVSDGVNVVAFDGDTVDKSTILHGLLLQCPEIVSHSKQIMQMRTLKSEQDGSYTLVAFVTVSMSGDTEEVGSMQFESDMCVDTDHCFLDILEEFCDKLTAENVGLLLCQRVVHPRLKQRLRQQSIVVVDRLGVTMTAYIQDVSGAVPIRSFHNLDVQMMGKVAGVEHKIFQDKSYLLLSPLADKCVVTLILYSPEEEQLSELKILCSSCLLSLRHLVQSPRALLGAGCWQKHLAAVLKNKVKANRADIVRKTGCTILSLTQACKVFTNTLEKIAVGTGHDGQDHMSDIEYGHLWRLPRGSNPDPEVVLKCACGVFQQNMSKLNDLIGSPGIVVKTGTKEDPNGHSRLDIKQKDLDVILDLSAPCVAALTSGVLTANTVLSIGQFIQDNN